MGCQNVVFAVQEPDVSVMEISDPGERSNFLFKTGQVEVFRRLLQKDPCHPTRVGE